MKAWHLLFIALLAADATAINITEIMYNPSGDDNNKEFIEILLDAPLNLSGFIIGDSASNDTLGGIRVANSSYALIVEEGFNATGINASIYSAGSTIGNNLDNAGDTVFLYMPDGSLVATASYDGSIANGNGKSVEFINGTPRESLDVGGSSGRENPVPLPMPEVNMTAGNDTESIDGPPEENMTSEEPAPEGCAPSISISTPKDVYQNKEQIAFTFHVNDTDSFSVEYGVEDLLGRTVKKYLTTTSLKTKTYTPSIKEQDKALVIKARLHASCTDIVAQAEKQVIVLNPDGEAEAAESEEADAPPTDDEETPEKTEKKGKPKKISYDLFDLPEQVENGSEFKTRLWIENDGQKRHFEVWSYVYRGPKSYSGEREDNLQELDLEADEEATVELESAVEAAPGQYKYKVKVRKDDQSSTTDITREIAVVANKTETLTENQTMSVIHPALAAGIEEIKRQPAIEAPARRETLVFEGKAERVKRGIPYFLLAVLGLVVLVFVWRS